MCIRDRSDPCFLRRPKENYVVLKIWTKTDPLRRDCIIYSDPLHSHNGPIDNSIAYISKIDLHNQPDCIYTKNRLTPSAWFLQTFLKHLTHTRFLICLHQNIFFNTQRCDLNCISSIVGHIWPILFIEAQTPLFCMKMTHKAEGDNFMVHSSPTHGEIRPQRHRSWSFQSESFVFTVSH